LGVIKSSDYYRYFFSLISRITFIKCRIDFNGRFASKIKTAKCGNIFSVDKLQYQKEERVDRIIHDVVESVSEEAQAEISTLSVFQDCSANGVFESIQGIRIIHLFIFDILGRHSTAAKVFKIKTQEE
jgi:hypothetical protein